MSALVNSRSSSNWRAAKRWASSTYAACRVSRLMQPMGLRGLVGGERGEHPGAGQLCGWPEGTIGRIILTG